MNKLVFILFFCLLIKTAVFGQPNLVPNFSFENYQYCPAGIADFTVSNWYNATWGSCDYFNSCNLSDAGIPTNYFGTQQAHSGDACVGFGSIFDPTDLISSREYLQIQLSNSLQANKSYRFSCFINKADSASVCVEEISIAFSVSAIGGSYLSPISFSPQLSSINSDYLCNSQEWIQIEGIYTASGGESYLTIGYFKDNQNADTIVINNSSGFLFAYYYVDDVVLEEIAFIDNANVFTPDGDGINDFWNSSQLLDFSEIIIFNRWGEKIVEGKDSKTFQWDGYTQEGKKCTEGIYYYQIVAKSNIYTGFIDLVR